MPRPKARPAAARVPGAPVAPQAPLDATPPPDPGQVQLADLVADPQNRRLHSDRNLSAIANSLQAVGAARSIVIDENNVVLAGNGVTTAAAGAGMTTVRVIEADGHELIAVRRRGLTDEQKRHLAMFDNRTAELAEWNLEQLKADQVAGLDITPFFFEDELKALFRSSDAKPGLTDPDAVPAVPTATSIQAGDLFQLGPHRLLCGDATVPADVARLMDGNRALLFATDPPYAIGYEGGAHPSTPGNKGVANKNKDWSEVYHEVAPRKAWKRFDPLQPDQGEAFYTTFVKVSLEHPLAPTAAWYCWHASHRQAMIERVWEAAGAFMHQQIIWAKSRPVLMYSIYMWAHEPCMMGWQRGQKPFVQRKHESYPTTIWSVPSGEVSKDHPTSKPVRLFTLPMDMHTVATEICYEPFSGSGTQIIAAEQLGRRCFAMEITPSFVQVAIDRWEAFTGQKAQKVGEAARAPRT